jgi:DNA-binding NarL/FixJ family response regulator
MLRGGARGYLVHGQFELADVLRAVRAVAEGHGWLSPTAASAAACSVRRQAEQERAGLLRAEREQRAQARFGLTPREREVLALLGQGLSNVAIARALAVTEKTVKNHLNHIFAKLGARNRTEAVLRWSAGE